MLRFVAILAIGSLVIPIEGLAACLPLSQGLASLEKVGSGKSNFARFQGEQAKRMIKRLVPNAGAEFDLVFLVPKKDGEALLMLASTRQSILCVGEPEQDLDAAHIVDAIGYSQSGGNLKIPSAIKKGMLYSQARATLLSYRFSPIPSDDLPEERCSIGREDVCRAYPEAVACAGTGRAFCSFQWSSPNGVPFHIVTAGEELARITVESVGE